MALLGRDKTDRCDHPQHSVTSYAGLERAVCDECGQICIEAVGEGDPGVLFKPRGPAHSLMAIHGPHDDAR